MRAEDLTCSLGVLYGGLEIIKMEIVWIKIFGKKSCCNIFSIFGYQNP
jgi:hypothetical protein